MYRHSYTAFVYFAILSVSTSVAIPFEASTEVISTENASVDKLISYISTRFRIMESKLVNIENRLETLDYELNGNAQKPFGNETQRIISRNIVRSVENGQFNVTKEFLEQNADTTQISKIIHQVVLSGEIDIARILKFENGLNNLSYALLKSLWNEVRISGLISTNNLFGLLVQFEALPLEVSVSHEHNRSAIIDEMERMLNARTYDIILKYLTNQTSAPSKDLLSLGGKFENHKSEKKFHQIVGNAVNVAYETVDVKDILNQIENLSKNLSSDKTLVIVGICALFWKAKEKNQLTDQLSVDILISLDVENTEIGHIAASELKKVLQSIPTCLRNLVHKNYVSIQSAATKEIVDGNDYDEIVFTSEHSFTTWYVRRKGIEVNFQRYSETDPNWPYLSHTASKFGMTYLGIAQTTSDSEDEYDVEPSPFTIQTHGQYCSIKIGLENKYMVASGIRSPFDDRQSFVLFGAIEDPSKDSRYLWKFI